MPADCPCPNTKVAPYTGAKMAWLMKLYRWLYWSVMDWRGLKLTAPSTQFSAPIPSKSRGLAPVAVWRKYVTVAENVGPGVTESCADSHQAVLEAPSA